jgi:hypothetical protein
VNKIKIKPQISMLRKFISRKKEYNFRISKFFKKNFKKKIKKLFVIMFSN